MVWIRVTVGIALSAVLYYFYLRSNTPVPVPIKMNPKAYWGPSGRAKRVNATDIVPFEIQYSGEVIDHLHRRLAEPLRSPEPLEGVGFRYGFNKHQLEKIVTYWRDDYLPRWEQRQSFLNALPQYHTEIQGLKIHFIHTKDMTPKGKPVVPILLLHGWPGSIREFYEFIPKLIAPQKDVDVSFVVVAPSLPGYGFSEGAAIPGLGVSEIAVIARNLMLRLGYKRFLIQGGDWGAMVGNVIATLYPRLVIGYHSNMCSAALTAEMATKTALASTHSSFYIPPAYSDFVFPLWEKFSMIIEETGYLHLQATKPDTIGIALTQNPVGLAAYILEKFSTWADPADRDTDDGGLSKHFSWDALLDNIMIYYLTDSITTSVRLYAETLSLRHQNLGIEKTPTKVPTGCARFQHELLHQMDWQLKDKFLNLIHSTYHRGGGHFAAFQKPDVLYQDFITFVKKVDLTIRNN